MEETLILFETAKLAEEKGCNLPCKEVYNPDKKLVHSRYRYRTENEPNYPAPTQSLLQKWLRGETEIHVQVMCNHSGWFWDIEKTNGTSLLCDESRNPFHDTYEQALEQGLLEALKLTPTK